MGVFDSPWHIIILLVVVLLLFGSARLPGAAKSLGSAMRIFKKEVSGHDGEAVQTDTGQVRPVGALPPAQQQAAAAQAAASQAAAQASAAAASQDDHQQRLADLERQLQELKNRQP
jgi:sec-independent protein translocase protein TatA